MVEVGWITFHRWFFDSEQTVGALTLPAPEGAAWWHFGPDSPIGPDGLRTGRGRSWAGAGFFADLAAADRVLDDPAVQFPDLPAHGEAFHCLLRPIRFSGDCRWLSGANATLAVAEADPGGPAVVLTSAGYDDMGPEQTARMRDFRENVDRVRAWYDEIDGNIVNGNFATGTDGMTFSLWRSDDALRAGAYGPGLHRAQLDRQKAERLADRTSYTRTRLLRHTGTWDGRDPLIEVA
jgi:hypothetical protein